MMREVIMKGAAILIAAAAVLSAGFLIKEISRPDYEGFAECLTEKGVMMYGTDWCHACISQKERFKGSFDSIRYIECSQEDDRCEKIHAFPTWEHRDRLYRGVHSIGQLEEITGCST